MTTDSTMAVIRRGVVHDAEPAAAALPEQNQARGADRLHAIQKRGEQRDAFGRQSHAHIVAMLIVVSSRAGAPATAGASPSEPKTSSRPASTMTGSNTKDRRLPDVDQRLATHELHRQPERQRGIDDGEIRGRARRLTPMARHAAMSSVAWDVPSGLS